MPLELQTKLSVLQFLGQLSARGSVQVREGSCYTCDSCTQGSAPNHCLNKSTLPEDYPLWVAAESLALMNFQESLEI